MKTASLIFLVATLPVAVPVDSYVAPVKRPCGFNEEPTTCAVCNQICNEERVFCAQYCDGIVRCRCKPGYELLSRDIQLCVEAKYCPMFIVKPNCTR